MKLKNLEINIYGASHERCVGLELSGIPKGEFINLGELQSFCDRRKPSGEIYSTKRSEPDIVNILSGITSDVACGAACGVTDGNLIRAEILNKDTRSADYEETSHVPRPSHADYTSYIKYGKIFPGGGRFSGRMTAPLVIAGGIAKQILCRSGIEIVSRVEDFEAMLEEIKSAADAGDSVGGIIETVISGLPAGLGGELFDGLEGKISALVFAIPAVKGIEFGSGFAFAKMRGNEANDQFGVTDGKVITKTNHSGGILGGISSGMPITFRVAVKPTPSISLPQKSVDLRTLTETELVIKGRHDVCITPRAAVAVEAAAALAIYDELLEKKEYYE